MPINLAFGGVLLAGLALLLFTGGLVHTVGYVLIALIALLELTFGLVAGRLGPTFGPGDDWPGVREPRRPSPTHGADGVTLP